jgi:hypothetical protein
VDVKVPQCLVAEHAVYMQYPARAALRPKWWHQRWLYPRTRCITLTEQAQCFVIPYAVRTWTSPRKTVSQVEDPRAINQAGTDLQLHQPLGPRSSGLMTRAPMSLPDATTTARARACPHTYMYLPPEHRQASMGGVRRQRSAASERVTQVGSQPAGCVDSRRLGHHPQFAVTGHHQLARVV